MPHPLDHLCPTHWIIYAPPTGSPMPHPLNHLNLSLRRPKHQEKHRYCAVVELTILRKTTSNRMALFIYLFYLDSSASGVCTQKIGMFYWINDFSYFFEGGMRWTRKIKIDSVVEHNGCFYQTTFHFLIVLQPLYGTEFGTLFCLQLHIGSVVSVL